jgi:hypothetical protein
MPASNNPLLIHSSRFAGPARQATGHVLAILVAATFFSRAGFCQQRVA